MSYNASVFKVMIASPGDVSAERGLVREILGEWNVIHSENRKVVLLPIGWETHSSPEMGGSAQSILNRTVLRDCDLLVGIFWTRLGTPTEDYASGTVEEIERHITANKPTMLYFSSAPIVLDSVDMNQYERLNTFKTSCKSRGLLESYSDLSEFRSKFARQIQLTVNKNPYFGSPAPGYDVLRAESTRPVITLSREAQDLLRQAAATDGQILMLRFIGGESLQAGGRYFIEGRDPRSSAVWQGALEELESCGLINTRDSKRQVFRVTREGYDFYDASLK